MSPAPIAFAPPLPSRGLGERLVERYVDWRRKRRWIAELHEAAALGRLDDVLDDIGLTHEQLDRLIDAPADAGQQFETLAAMAHIDLHHLPPETLREAMWTCVNCACREACKRWLDTGEWRDSEDSRCPNAALFRQ